MKATQTYNLKKGENIPNAKVNWHKYSDARLNGPWLNGHPT